MTDLSDAPFEPRVGEIRALRTFRVGPGGLLYPLFSTRPWTDGANTARCRFEPAHQAPESGCSCGFYAYADPRGAAEYPHARYVLAVVACWGRVIAGTRGLRAEYARVEGLWLAPIVPAPLAAQVAQHYPGVRLYPERAALLAAHPPTVLDDYDAPPVRHPGRGRLGYGAGLLAGLAPHEWISRMPCGWLLWCLAVGVLLLVAALPRVQSTDHTANLLSQRRRLLCLALALWIVAPLAGVLGVLLLRLPMIQIGTLTMVHRLAARRAARTFPAAIV